MPALSPPNVRALILIEQHPDGRISTHGALQKGVRIDDPAGIVLREALAFLAEHLHIQVFEAERQCRKCGCTEERACPPPAGPCFWVEYDLCSACSPRGARSRPYRMHVPGLDRKLFSAPIKGRTQHPHDTRKKRSR